MHVGCYEISDVLYLVVDAIVYQFIRIVQDQTLLKQVEGRNEIQNVRVDACEHVHPSVNPTLLRRKRCFWKERGKLEQLSRQSRQTTFHARIPQSHQTLKIKFSLNSSTFIKANWDSPVRRKFDKMCILEIRGPGRIAVLSFICYYIIQFTET